MAARSIGSEAIKTANNPAASAVRRQHRRVLIVDDDRSIRSLIGMALSLDGYRFAQASNGQEATKKVREAEPAIVILDLSMPVMGGMEFYHWLRDSGRTELPVILLTAGLDGQKVCQELGAQGWLKKPFELAELQAYVRKYMTLITPGATEAGRTSWGVVKTLGGGK